MQIQIQIWNLAFICVSSLSSGRNSSSNSLGIHIESDSLLSSFSTSHILLFTSSLILKWLSRHHWNLQRSRSGSELGWSETGKTKVHVETNTKTNTTGYNCLWTWIQIQLADNQGQEGSQVGWRETSKTLECLVFFFFVCNAIKLSRVCIRVCGRAIKPRKVLWQDLDADNVFFLRRRFRRNHYQRPVACNSITFEKNCIEITNNESSHHID